MRRKLPFALLILGAAFHPAFCQPAPRAPQGIYAVVDTTGLAPQPLTASCSTTAAQSEAYFDSLYQQLLSDPAISGLALQVHWDSVNQIAPPASDAYCWWLIDDAFTQAALWDSQNPKLPPKTIQLLVTPGFQSPQWLLDQIPLCDGAFQTPVVTPPSNCGAITFTGYQENGDSTVLPLPWNPVYNNAWQTFVTALAARYLSNPAFVSIAIAGPTAASDEMTTVSDSTASAQSQFGNMQPNAIWRQLIQMEYGTLSNYQSVYKDTDQFLIDAWDNAIEMFGQIFSGITLVATTGSGFPNLSQIYTMPPAPFSDLCTANPNMLCAAVATILSDFAALTTGGNAKATQTSGMEASRAISPGNLGVAGVQYLAQVTASNTTPSTQILGGAQFNTSFSNAPVVEGCTGQFPPNLNNPPAGCSPGTCTANACMPIGCIPTACLAPGITPGDLSGYSQYSQVPNKDLTSPEQAEYNVLNVYFNTTAAAADFGGLPNTPPAPMNYLQIYSPDILYAETHVKAAQVMETSGNLVPLTAQSMLNLASQDLQQTAEWPLSAPPAGLAINLTHTGAFNQSQQGLTYNINIGDGAGAAATSSMVTVTENLPAGMTLVSMSGTGWGCSSNQCFRNDPLSPGTNYQPITVTVNTAPNAPSMVTNQVSVWGGGSPSATANDLTSIATFTCDIDGNGVTNVVDVEIVVDEALGFTRAVNDLNHDGVVNAADVQKAVNAALGRGCPY